jgi:hypothetical protein
MMSEVWRATAGMFTHASGLRDRGSVAHDSGKEGDGDNGELHGRS